MYFSNILFQKFLIFHIWSLSENVQCFVGVLLEVTLGTTKSLIKIEVSAASSFLAVSDLQ